MTRTPAALALLLLAALAPAASAASWSAPIRVTSSGTAFGPAVALGSPDVAGITYSRTIHGSQRIEYRRAVGGRLRPIVIVDRHSRDESPAVTFAGPTAAVAWVQASRSGRVVATSRVSPRGVVSGPRLLGGTPAQYQPRFPVASQLLFNTRATSTVARVAPDGTIAAGVKLPRGATFDATVVVAGNGDRVALWSDRGRVYTARETAGTFRFSAPVRVSLLTGYARDPHLVVTADGTVMALWRQSGAIEAATISPASITAPRELVPGSEAAEGLSAIATSAGDVAVTYVSSPGDTPAGELRTFRVGPTTPPSATQVVTRPGERTRVATLGADSSAAWAVWTTAGQGTRHAIRVARLPLSGAPSAPRTLSGRESAATTQPAFALSARGRGIVTWATARGQIRAVARAGL